jgi:hypothetical protein
MLFVASACAGDDRQTTSDAIQPTMSTVVTPAPELESATTVLEVEPPTTIPGSETTPSTESSAPSPTEPDDPADPVATGPRVLIDTDLGGDPDDIQSLVRAIHYSDLLRIEGIVTTVGPGTGDAAKVREWIKRTDVDHLRGRGYTGLATEAELLGMVHAGEHTTSGPGNSKGTPGSRHIIARARAGTADDPLWVLAWGSLGSVAQALHDDPGIAPLIRIYSIGDYNTRANIDARDYLLGPVLDAHPDLWWVENGVYPLESRSTFRGVWRGGNQRGEWDRKAFVTTHIRGHGTDGDGEFSQVLGDAFPVANSPEEAVGSLKEGDSPSLLYLLSPVLGGVGDLDDPTVPSWGGRFRRADSAHSNRYIDLDCATKEACQATINRHRVDFLADWRDRWDRYDEDVVEPQAISPPPASASEADEPPLPAGEG